MNILQNNQLFRKSIGALSIIGILFVVIFNVQVAETNAIKETAMPDGQVTKEYITVSGGSWVGREINGETYRFHSGKLLNDLSLEEATNVLIASGTTVNLSNLFAVANVHNNYAFTAGLTSIDLLQGYFPTDIEMTALAAEDPNFYKYVTRAHTAGKGSSEKNREETIILYSFVLDGTYETEFQKGQVKVDGGYINLFSESSLIGTRTLEQAEAIITAWLQTTTYQWPFVDCTEYADYLWMNCTNRWTGPIELVYIKE